MLSGEGGILSLEGIRLISIFRHQSIRRQRRRWWQSPRGRSKVVSSRNRRSILRSFEYLLSRKGLRHQWISNIRLFQILIRQRRRSWRWPRGRSEVVSSRNHRNIRSCKILLCGVFWWIGYFFTSADLLYARCFSFVKANIFAGEIAGVKDAGSWQTQRWPEWSARKEADWDMADFVGMLTRERAWRFSFRKAVYHWCFCYEFIQNYAKRC